VSIFYFLTCLDFPDPLTLMYAVEMCLHIINAFNVRYARHMNHTWALNYGMILASEPNSVW